MKKLLWLLAVCLVLWACSDDESTPGTPNVEKIFSAYTHRPFGVMLHPYQDNTLHFHIKAKSIEGIRIPYINDQIRCDIGW